MWTNTGGKEPEGRIDSQLLILSPTTLRCADPGKRDQGRKPKLGQQIGAGPTLPKSQQKVGQGEEVPGLSTG